MVDTMKPKVGKTLNSFANAILAISIRLTEGQGDGPWEGRRMSTAPGNIEDCMDSLGRHMCAYFRGDTDEDHLTALVTNALIALELRERKNWGVNQNQED